MKCNNLLAFLITMICFTNMSYGQSKDSPVNYFGVNSMLFNNTTYNLAWSSHPSSAYYKHEYLPKGESVDKFKSMILLEVLIGNSSIKDIASAKLEELKKMKAANPAISYEIFNNPSTGEYMLDFVLTANNADGTIGIVERNVYRYKKYTGDSGQTGVLLFGVSTRSYGTAVDSFFTSLKTNRKDLVDKVSKFTIPAITLKK